MIFSMSAIVGTANGFTYISKGLCLVGNIICNKQTKYTNELINICMVLDDKNNDSGEYEAFGEGNQDSGADAGLLLKDLYWRVEKLRLEEENTKRFLKAKPRFLPYGDCRKWVQAFGRRWTTEEEWKEWISMGEKKNPYIPVRYSGLDFLSSP
jgi:hypothetical protein